MNRWRVGDDRGSKETDGCPLTPRVLMHHFYNFLHGILVYGANCFTSPLVTPCEC
jgi:hypothetical protein